MLRKSSWFLAARLAVLLRSLRPLTSAVLFLTSSSSCCSLTSSSLLLSRCCLTASVFAALLLLSKGLLLTTDILPLVALFQLLSLMFCLAVSPDLSVSSCIVLLS